MYAKTCLLCQEDFSHKTKEWAYRKLIQHLKNTHHKEIRDYVAETEYDGSEPTCGCGCGTAVNFRKGRFITFFSDHKKYAIVPENVKEKLRQANYERYRENYINLGLTSEQLNYYWALYQTPDYNREKLQELANIDFRTISSWWIKLGITSKSNLQKVCYRHKHFWANQGEKNGQYIQIPEDLLERLSDYARFYKSTVHKRIALITLKNTFGLEYSSWVLGRRLKLYLGDEHDELITNGLSSDIELEFLAVLKFFFGYKNVKHQFKLDGRPFDFFLYEKLLIELDGSFWHDPNVENSILGPNQREIKEERNKRKTEIAEQYHIPLIRLSEKDCKNPNVINHLSELINNEIQTNSNSYHQKS